MKKLLYILVFVVLAGVSLAWLSGRPGVKRFLAINAPKTEDKSGMSAEIRARVLAQAKSAKQYVKSKSFNEEVCFLIDMDVQSGAARFFVYNLKKDSIVNQGLVTHGRCNQEWLEGRKYGNTVGCGCSSLGRYKIGKEYYGRFGLAYKLHGLDSTNSKAIDRFVVLHSHECVPEAPVNDEICQSDGCPTVSPNFLKYLKPIINQSKKPVMLAIYD